MILNVNGFPPNMTLQVQAQIFLRLMNWIIVLNLNQRENLKKMINWFILTQSGTENRIPNEADGDFLSYCILAFIILMFLSFVVQSINEFINNKRK